MFTHRQNGVRYTVEVHIHSCIDLNCAEFQIYGWLNTGLTKKADLPNAF